jgi:hypothetical protein
MESVLGSSLLGLIVLTLVLFGGAAFMTGQAVAATWRPAWNVVLYCALLGLADRFLHFALFEGQLLSVTGYAVDTATHRFRASGLPGNPGTPHGGPVPVALRADRPVHVAQKGKVRGRMSGHERIVGVRHHV